MSRPSCFAAATTLSHDVGACAKELFVPSAHAALPATPAFSKARRWMRCSMNPSPCLTIQDGLMRPFPPPLETSNFQLVEINRVATQDSLPLIFRNLQI